MTKRHSNFHRARKWHRKYVKALYAGRSAQTYRYLTLFQKYEQKCFSQDRLMVGISGQGYTSAPVISFHMDDVFDKLKDHVKKYPIEGDDPEGYRLFDSCFGG